MGQAGAQHSQSPITAEGGAVMRYPTPANMAGSRRKNVIWDTISTGIALWPDVRSGSKSRHLRPAQPSPLYPPKADISGKYQRALICKREIKMNWVSLPMAISIAIALFAQDAVAKNRLTDPVKIARDCKNELELLCRGVRPGGQRIKDCLKARNNELSPECLTTLKSAE
jgi:hypothetical protein